MPTAMNPPLREPNPSASPAGVHTPVRHRIALLFIAFLCFACSGIEEKRIRELLVEKGFGTRAEGNATIENYVAGRDLVQFVISPDVYAQPGAQQLFLLTRPQPLGIDGTILLPYVGPVYVLGLTQRELKDLVETQLQPLFTFEVDVEPSIISRGKAVYIYGEVLGPRRVPLTTPDMTILEFIMSSNLSVLANWGRIQLIRPDAENPLVIPINVREMLQTGLTTFNVAMQENDIVYVPPTFFGALTRFIQKLLQPLGVVVNTLLGIANIEAAYDFVFDDGPFFFGFGGGGGFNTAGRRAF